MQMKTADLFHDMALFSREHLEERREKFGFSKVRVELFLWDLELFLQIQDIFKDRIVLKGGAAVQFYLPAIAQRTSVDIDVLFAGTKDEIESALIKIYNKLGEGNNFFLFRPHVPKRPKTTLPLYTYYVDVPTVLTSQEINGRKQELTAGYQELKVEFIIESKPRSLNSLAGENLFVGASPLQYNILPLNELMADKLTTLGPNTIGVQEERKDEQVKQFYDIWMLLECNLDKLNIDVIRKKYWERAENECKNREREFSPSNISEDVLAQLQKYAVADFGFEGSETFVNEINNFKGLYLSRKIDFSAQNVACGARKIQLFINELYDDTGSLDTIIRSVSVSELLMLSDFSGAGKGLLMKELRTVLTDTFSDYTSVPEKILKGKRPQRIYWEIVTKKNIQDIERVVLATIEKFRTEN